MSNSQSQAVTCPCIVNERTVCRPMGGTCWHFGNDRPECAFCKNRGLYHSPKAVARVSEGAEHG